MSTIHFRIDDQTKRLAMQAADRQKISLTEIMRLRAEELAAEERQYQNNEHDLWLEQQITQAFNRYSSEECEFISNDEMNQYMDKLKARQHGANCDSRAVMGKTGSIGPRKYLSLPVSGSRAASSKRNR